MITPEDLKHWFTYHKPEGDQPAKYERIREAAFQFSLVLIQNTSACADQTVAIRKVREAVMVANASIACGGR